MTSTVEGKKGFRLTLPITRHYIDNGFLYIEGALSDSSRDSRGTKMGIGAMVSMVECVYNGTYAEVYKEFRRIAPDKAAKIAYQLGIDNESEIQQPLGYVDNEHSESWIDQMGRIIEARILYDADIAAMGLDTAAFVSPVLWVKLALPIEHPYVPYLAGQLDRGVKLGLSVAGEALPPWDDITDAVTNLITRVFQKVVLFKAAITKQPANRNAWLFNIARSVDYADIAETDGITESINRGEVMQEKENDTNASNASNEAETASAVTETTQEAAPDAVSTEKVEAPATDAPATEVVEEKVEASTTPSDGTATSTEGETTATAVTTTEEAAAETVETKAESQEEAPTSNEVTNSDEPETLETPAPVARTETAPVETVETTYVERAYVVSLETVLRSEIGTLRSELETAKTLLSQVPDFLNSQAETITTLRTEIDTLRSEYESTRDELEAAKDTIEALEAAPAGRPGMVSAHSLQSLTRNEIDMLPADVRAALISEAVQRNDIVTGYSLLMRKPLGTDS